MSCLSLSTASAIWKSPRCDTKLQKHRKPGEEKKTEAELVYVFKFSFLAEQPYEKRFKEALLSVSADLSS